MRSAPSPALSCSNTSGHGPVASSRASRARATRARPSGWQGPQGNDHRLSIEIDATDQLETGNPIAIASGVTPTLAALETMIYPKSALVIANTLLAAVGMITVLPAEGPMIVFVFGPNRVLPVRLSGLTITEEAYDPLLNPIRAKVELTLDVLSYNDLKIGSPGHALFLAHQIAKETLAATNIFASAANIGSGIKL